MTMIGALELGERARIQSALPLLSLLVLLTLCHAMPIEFHFGLGQSRSSRAWDR